jgi:Fe-S-cluster formation regulator IscX/YfhJ
VHFGSAAVAKKHLVDTYFRFLNLAQAVQALPSFPKLDAAEERLLEALTAAWHAGRTLSVTETMALSIAGAPATVHRKLARLRREGLVSVDESSTDLRAKTVVPTRKALDYFEKLAACLEEAKRK